jgi:hypothetical protein
MTHFDVGQYGASDTEGLAYEPGSDTLLVGDRPSHKIYQVTKAGALVRIIDASGVAGLSLISGLTVAPASDESGRSDYWIVDRAVDNGANPNENDGKLFEVKVPGSGGEPTILPGAATITEGNSGTKTVNVPVTLSQASSSQVTVDYQTLDNTAKAPSDYSATNGTLTFAPGQTSKTIPVTVKGDVTREPDEGAFVSLSNPVGAKLGGVYGLAHFSITNDDPVPVVQPSQVSVFEDDSGSKTVSVPVTLSNPSSTSVTVDYTTRDHTATAPSDYVSESGTITFAPGQTAAAVAVTTHGDTTVEEDEVFLVQFRNPKGATVGGYYGLGFVFLTNDD